MRRRIRGSLLLGGVVAVAGCGATSAHLTASQWQRQATAICDTAAGKTVHVIADLQDPSNPRQVTSYLRVVADTTRQMDHKLAQLQGPANLTANAHTVIEDNEATVRAENVASDRLSRLSPASVGSDATIERIFAPVQTTANRGQVRAAASPVPASCVLTP